ncbi:CCA tRNA nucleotidyltransferase, mitochondrial [Spiromyces aspiralis]|uniref:CCA tRNA nucleotidyltransferase, mitochondrial n=1 Tax=Spiromyces aspiralis TaxID=68401 RepID=A0ACC1HN27_9FUNG|nr:CCA tRNA nucleotidyltransferase, mitochondrial [Spiromyces aspiralis]
MRVVLDETEDKVCDLLDRVTRHLSETRPDLPRLTLRIAGGWVRDKLLGKECHDLDIAVNHMTGYQLATHVNDFLKAQGLDTRSIAKIQLNPERSKHLETATTVIFGLSIDFVNLRSETYNANSRIPIVEFGTPYEDALRRDTTINALFYNIHSRKVEDFTGKGLEDLRRGLIRTPMAPYETFRDDPLRVLRVIRFASRFNFAIVKEVINAIKRPEIKADLAAKISRERVGVEVDKMLCGPNPLLSIQLIHDYGLFCDIFVLPDNPDFKFTGKLKDPALSLLLARQVHSILSDPLFSQEPVQALDSGEVRGIYLACCLYPFIDMTVEEKNKKVVSAAKMILRDGVKLTNADIDTVSTLHGSLGAIDEALIGLRSGELSRVDLGLSIRSIGKKWRSAVLFSCAVQAALDKQGRDSIVQRHRCLFEKTYEWGLAEVYKMKPIVDGKVAAQLLGIKPGPVIRKILDDVIVWQLGNPTGTAEECKRYVVEKFGSK